jgi:hypothetical protein
VARTQADSLLAKLVAKLNSCAGNRGTNCKERVEHPGLPGVLRHSVKLRTLPHDTSLRERVEHPGLPGVLRHSVKLRTLPQDTSLRERVENKSYPDLAGMMTSPTQRTM